jgi:hypothetical protein
VILAVAEHLPFATVAAVYDRRNIDLLTVLRRRKSAAVIDRRYRKFSGRYLRSRAAGFAQ